MKPNNPFNLSLPKQADKQYSNIIKFPIKEPIQYEIRFIIFGSDHSIPLPTILIEDV